MSGGGGSGSGSGGAPSFVFDFAPVSQSTPPTIGSDDFQFGTPNTDTGSGSTTAVNPFQSTATSAAALVSITTGKSSSVKPTKKMIKLDRLKVAATAPGDDPFLTNMIWTALSGGGGGGLPVVELVSIIVSFIREFTFISRPAVQKQLPVGSGSVGAWGSITGNLHYVCESDGEGGVIESIVAGDAHASGFMRQSLLDGRLSPVAVPDESGSDFVPVFYHPRAICIDPVSPDSFYLTNSHSIYRFNSASKTLERLEIRSAYGGGLLTQSTYVVDLLCQSDGKTLWVVEYDSHSVSKLDLTSGTGTIITVMSGRAGLDYPRRIVFDRSLDGEFAAPETVLLIAAVSGVHWYDIRNGRTGILFFQSASSVQCTASGFILFASSSAICCLDRRRGVQVFTTLIEGMHPSIVLADQARCLFVTAGSNYILRSDLPPEYFPLPLL